MNISQSLSINQSFNQIHEMYVSCVKCVFISFTILAKKNLGFKCTLKLGRKAAVSVNTLIKIASIE